MSNNNNQRQNNQIGAAWLKQSQNGTEYISITFKPEALEQFDLANCWISMNPNKYKQKDSHPDYILTAKPKQQQGNQRQAPPQQRQQSNFPKPQNRFPKPQNNGGGGQPGWDDGDPGPEF